MRIRKGLKVFFSYYGGKSRIAQRYPPPRHDTIVEPFAGAAGYSLLYYQRKVILADVNEKIAGVWDYLIHTPSLEIIKLPLQFDDVRDLSIPQEAKWLIGWWLMDSQSRPSYTRPSRVDQHPDAHWSHIIRSRIASQVEMIRHWKVHHYSYTHLPNVDATWYIDPPYTGATGGTGYEYGSSGIDYSHLSQWCQERPGQVIVCEQKGATWLPFRTLIKSAAGNYRRDKGGRQVKTEEMIWTN